MSRITEIKCKSCGRTMEVLLNGAAESIVECPACHKMWAAKQKISSDDRAGDGVTVQEILTVVRKDKREEQIPNAEEGFVGIYSSFGEECLDEESLEEVVEDKEQISAVEYPKKKFMLEQPDGVSSEVEFEIEGNTLKKYKGNGGDVVIPDYITIIGDNAFSECTDLTSIMIPNSVEYIGSEAFKGCRNLKSVTFRSGETGIGNEAESSDLSDITGFNRFVSIGDSAFKWCSSLTSIVIPDSVTSIGNSAFAYCEVLTSIEIPAGVTSIGEGAFYRCSSLEKIEVEQGNFTYSSKGNCLIDTLKGELMLGCKNSVIPKGVTSIGSSAFEGCSWLTSVEIPNSVRSIGSGAFSGCEGLTSIEIPNSVTSIGESAFLNCTGLTSINIPNSVISIGSLAFSGCTGLTSVTIPSSVRSIGYGAFEGCTSLTSITVPFVGSCYYKEQRVPFFGNKEQRMAAFEENMDRWAANMLAENHFGYIFGAFSCNKNNESVPSSLKTVIITGGDSIGSRAFYGCEGLTSITIPNSVTSIGENVFIGCTGLKSVTMPRWLAGFRKNKPKLIFDKEQLKKIKFKFTK